MLTEEFKLTLIPQSHLMSYYLQSIVKQYVEIRVKLKISSQKNPELEALILSVMKYPSHPKPAYKLISYPMPGCVKIVISLTS